MKHRTISATSELFVKLTVGTGQTDRRTGVTRNAASGDGRVITPLELTVLTAVAI